ncbi:hypothetical protein B0H14DRAFT_3109214 [Mycena olivaceomarginata]|nr:hypothetical protein B0H14DRAFT_3109214 [Mycena olivaceomarginata]
MARWIRQVWGWPITSPRSSSLSRSDSQLSSHAHLESSHRSSDSTPSNVKRIGTGNKQKYIFPSIYGDLFIHFIYLVSVFIKHSLLSFPFVPLTGMELRYTCIIYIHHTTTIRRWIIFHNSHC